ncbi:hypothetical protein ACH5RR_028119 [Cinchona calisaya]|uniref:Uncharacterized protein n=1 Tax=Cinchona calisaya TaxID=153742 RepID=A0ABD2YP18_9GENT
MSLEPLTRVQLQIPMTSGATSSVTTTTVPVAHSDVPPDAESGFLPENSSETGASNSVGNTSTPVANSALTSRETTYTAATRSMITGSSGEAFCKGSCGLFGVCCSLI